MDAHGYHVVDSSAKTNLDPSFTSNMMLILLSKAASSSCGVGGVVLLCASLHACMHAMLRALLRD